MAEKGKVAAPGLGMLGGAGVVGLMAAGALTACAVLVLVDLPAGLAVGPPCRIGVGGRRLPARRCVARQQVAKAGAPIPEQTIETVKEDLEWAKTRATSARK